MTVRGPLRVSGAAVVVGRGAVVVVVVVVLVVVVLGAAVVVGRVGSVVVTPVVVASAVVVDVVEVDVVVTREVVVAVRGAAVVEIELADTGAVVATMVVDGADVAASLVATVVAVVATTAVVDGAAELEGAVDGRVLVSWDVVGDVVDGAAVDDDDGVACVVVVDRSVDVVSAAASTFVELVVVDSTLRSTRPDSTEVSAAVFDPHAAEPRIRAPASNHREPADRVSMDAMIRPTLSLARPHATGSFVRSARATLRRWTRPRHSGERCCLGECRDESVSRR